MDRPFVMSFHADRWLGRMVRRQMPPIEKLARAID
jgi:hypothetical protein